MRDLAIHAAGGFAVLAATLHGVLGETRIFAKAHIEPARIKLMLRLVWQCSTVAWIGLGVLLTVTPHMASDAARHWIIAIAVATFGFGAVANAWATGGRHFGWMALTVVCVLVLAGR